METEYRVCDYTSLQPEQPTYFRIAERDLLVMVHQGELYALENRCGHMCAALHRGELTDGIIVCALHGAGFSVADGSVAWPAILPPPMSDYSRSENLRIRTFGELLEQVETLPIATYPVVVRDGVVYVDLIV